MENRDPNRLMAGFRRGGESSDSTASSLPSLRASDTASSSSFETGAAQPLALTNNKARFSREGRPDDELSGIDWVDSVVDVASTCKKILTAHTCRLCQVYTDKQVEYEVRQEESAQMQRHEQPARNGAPPGTASTSFFQTVMPSSLEVEMYRQFLFDEDSVVEGVNERVFDDDNDEEDEVDAQQLAAAAAVAAAVDANWS